MKKDFLQELVGLPVNAAKIAIESAGYETWIEGFRHKREKSPRWEVVRLLNNKQKFTLIKQNCTEYNEELVKAIIE